MKYIKKLKGTKVYLSPIDLEDAPKYAQWLNDLDVTRYLAMGAASLTLEREREILSHISAEHNYAIVDAATNELVGNVGLMDLDNLNRTAEIGIFLGDKSKWNKGFGYDAMTLLADYAFHVLGVRNLMLRAFDFNERGLACYKKVGFKEIGRRRQAHFWNGEYYDIVLMDLLAEEFGPSRIPSLSLG